MSVIRSSVCGAWIEDLLVARANGWTVASKCGFNCMNGGDRSVTNSAAHIKEYIEGTIERLGFAPDLYYLHRIDPSEYSPNILGLVTNQPQSDTPLEESIPALDEIRKAGKTKYIGLSECSAKTLRKANSSTLTCP